MSESTTKADAGWGWPSNSRRAHYFTADGCSVCGRWLFFGAVSDDNHDSSDNCTVCRRAREKRAKRAQKEVS